MWECVVTEIVHPETQEVVLQFYSPLNLRTARAGVSIELIRFLDLVVGDRLIITDTAPASDCGPIVSLYGVNEGTALAGVVGAGARCVRKWTPQRVMKVRGWKWDSVAQIEEKLMGSTRNMSRTEIGLRVGLDVPDSCGFSALRGILTGEADQGEPGVLHKTGTELHTLPVLRADLEVLRKHLQALLREVAEEPMPYELWDRCLIYMTEIKAVEEKIKDLECANGVTREIMAKWDEVLSRLEWRSALERVQSNDLAGWWPQRPGGN